MCVYQPVGSEKYHFNFTLRGRRYRGTCGTSNKQAALSIESAKRLMLEKLGGGVELPAADPSLAEMFDALERDFKMRDKWSARQASNFRELRAAFPKGHASTLTSADVTGYMARRQREGCAPATINRTTLLLSQAFALQKQSDPQFRPAPAFPHLSEKGNERKGFFEAEQFAAVLKFLPVELHDFCRFAYLTGWRKNEIAGLTWKNVEGDLIRLHGSQTKNEEPRCVPLNIGDLAAIIARRQAARHSQFANQDEPIFHRGDGRPIQEFRKSWATACKKAGVPGRIFHDFRRTAVRNLIRAGVPQSIAMKISGHKTASMFRRYDVANENDLREAMRLVQHYHETNAAKVAAIGLVAV